MDQDNERDYLGRQYGIGSSEPAGQYVQGAAGGYMPGAIPGAERPGPQAAPAPAPEDSAAQDPAPVRQVQVGTVVWGLVLTTLAVLLLLATTVALTVDPVLLVLGVTLGAGLALLLGGLLAALQRRRSRELKSTQVL